MTAAIRAPQPDVLALGAVRPTVRLVDPAWFPAPADEPPPLRLIPGGPDAARRRRRSPAIYRRRRVAAVLLALVVLVAGLSGARALERRVLEASPPSAAATADAASSAVAPPRSAAAGAASVGPAAPVHVVAPGDTVWSIARSLEPDGDVRPVVDELVRRNGGSTLEVGQRLDLSGLAP